MLVLDEADEMLNKGETEHVQVCHLNEAVMSHICRGVFLFFTWQNILKVMKNRMEFGAE